MNDEHIQQLGQIFPHLFPNGAEGLVWCGDGWFHIICCLCNNIMNYLHKRETSLPPIEIDQGKEKFGTLRFYTQGYYDDEIHRIIAEIEHLSGKKCELTGEEGSLHKKGGWLKTLSEKQAAEHGYTKVDTSSNNNGNINPWISILMTTKS